VKSDKLSYAIYCDEKIADFYSIFSGMTVDLQPGCHAVYYRALFFSANPDERCEFVKYTIDVFS
jgi:hypothetical protein